MMGRKPGTPQYRVTRVEAAVALRVSAKSITGRLPRSISRMTPMNAMIELGTEELQREQPPTPADGPLRTIDA
jgi:hypothetical protein